MLNYKAGVILLKYRIGIVAALFGLTRETLRNYERAELIISHRDPNSTYRYYDLETVRKLIGIRSMRNQGFSIEELKMVYTDVSMEELHTLMKTKIKLYEQKILYAQATYTQLKWIEAQYQCLGNNQIIQLQDSPELYIRPYTENRLLQIAGANAELMKWTQNLFLVQNYRRFSDDFMESYSAFAVTPAIATLLDLHIDKHVQYQKSMHCVSVLCERKPEHTPFAHILEQVTSYMHQENLRQSGNAFSLTIFAHHENGRKHSYIKLYIPISD